MGYRDLDEVSYSLIKEGKPYQKKLGEFLLDWIDKNTAISLKTSGSTGNPKSIQVEKQYMVNSALATGAYFDLRPGGAALLCLPGNYIAGKMMLVRAMVLGLELDWVAPTSTPLRLLDRSYDFCAMVPMQLENSLDQIDHIKTLIVGGAPMPESLKEKVQDKATVIYETYGLTETLSHIAIRKVNHGATDYFETLPNVKVGTDVRNCLVINAPDLSEAPIGTNDIVALLSERRFKWLGRHDNVINSGGIKLIPEQIEGKLTAVVKQRFFVAGIPDESLGERLVLFVETRHEDDGLRDRIAALKNLEKFEVPRDIVFVEQFAETENGKVSRPRTIAQYREGNSLSPSS